MINRYVVLHFMIYCEFRLFQNNTSWVKDIDWLSSKEMASSIVSWTMLVTGAFGLLLNIAVLVVLIKKLKHNQTNSCKFIVNLAVADMIFASCIVIFFSIRLAGLQVSTFYLTIYWNMSQGISFTASLFYILSISIDRLIGVMNHRNKHCRCLTPKRLNLIIVSLWLMSVIVASTQLWLPLIVIDVIVSIIIFVAFIVNTSVYMCIGYMLTNTPSTANFSAMQRQQRRKENKSTIVLCCLLSLTFFGCNIPFSVANLYYDFTKKEWSEGVAYMVYFLFSLKCIIDAILYTFIIRIFNYLAKKKKNTLLGKKGSDGKSSNGRSSKETMTTTL